MEKLIKTLTLIATTPDSHLHRLPLLHRSLIPLLSVASSLYRLSLFIRSKLFLQQQQRLPVPVISVGNLTWGGNGKTPMTEFVALAMAELGVLPLVLTRGYAGGDEAKMLHRHLSQASVRIGVGANRGAIAASMLARYRHMDSSLTFHKLSQPHRSEPGKENEKVGVVILDDGMQVSDAQLKVIESTVQKECSSVSIYFTRLTPSHFFEVKDLDSKLPLTIINNIVVLCVSGIGFPDAFVQAIKKIGPLHVGRLDFRDHHQIQYDDYDRDPFILKKQGDLTILVLCSSIQFIPLDNHTEEDFITKLNRLLINKYEWHG